VNKFKSIIGRINNFIKVIENVKYIYFIAFVLPITSINYIRYKYDWFRSESTMEESSIVVALAYAVSIAISYFTFAALIHIYRLLKDRR